MRIPSPPSFKEGAAKPKVCAPESTCKGLKSWLSLYVMAAHFPLALTGQVLQIYEEQATPKTNKRLAKAQETGSTPGLSQHSESEPNRLGFLPTQLEHTQPALDEAHASRTSGKTIKVREARQRSDLRDVEYSHLAEERVRWTPEAPLTTIEESDVLGRFLRDTLIRQIQIKKRGVIRYHTLLRWRKTVRDTQISALRAAKSNPSESLLRMVAGDLSSEARSIFGVESFDKVTHVACGHSGPNCFASQLAKAVADDLGKQYEPVFEPLRIVGSSHPKTNTRRPKAKLRVEPKGRYLLIDDVATSGHHIAEATRAIRGAHASASALAWVSN